MHLLLHQKYWTSFPSLTIITFICISMGQSSTRIVQVYLYMLHKPIINCLIAGRVLKFYENHLSLSKTPFIRVSSHLANSTFPHLSFHLFPSFTSLFLLHPPISLIPDFFLTLSPSVLPLFSFHSPSSYPSSPPSLQLVVVLSFSLHHLVFSDLLLKAPIILTTPTPPVEMARPHMISPNISVPRQQVHVVPVG